MSNKNLLKLLSVETKYSGDRIITRILQRLGCSEEVITTNPYVIEQVEMILRKLYLAGKIEGIPSNDVTEEQIGEMAEMIKNYKILSRQEIPEKMSKLEADDKTFLRENYGISVDPLTGELIIQQIILCNMCNNVKHRDVKTTRFKKGNEDSVIAISTIESKEGELIDTRTVTTIANRNGIVNSRKFEKGSGEAAKIERIKEAPILAKITFSYQTPKAETVYMPMDVDALPNLMEKQIRLNGDEECPKGKAMNRKRWGYLTSEEGKESLKYQGVLVVLQNMDTPVTAQAKKESPEYQRVLAKLQQKENVPITISNIDHFLADELFGKRYAFGMRKLIEEYRSRNGMHKHEEVVQE